MSVEAKMHEAVASVRQGRGPDYKPFTIGVSWEGWGYFVAMDDVLETITFHSDGIAYEVKPVDGLDGDEVALIWR